MKTHVYPAPMSATTKRVLLEYDMIKIIIIKRISRAPIYHARWQHRALYNNTNHTHTHSVGRGDRQSCEKNRNQMRPQTRRRTSATSTASILGVVVGRSVSQVVLGLEVRVQTT